MTCVNIDFYVTEEEYFDQQLISHYRDFIKSCFPSKYVNEFIISESTFQEFNDNIECYYRFCVTHDTYDILKQLISKLLYHQDVPNDGFEDIEHFDYNVHVASKDIDELQQYTYNIERKLEKERMTLTQYLICNMSDEIDKLKQEIQVLHSLNDKNGLNHFPSYIKVMNKILGDAGLINSEKLEELMFPKTH